MKKTAGLIIFVMLLSLAGTVNGQESHEISSIPEANSVSSRFSISAGCTHAVVKDEYGAVWTWGNNSSDRLKNDMNSENNVPVQIKGLTDVKKVSAGDNYTLALKKDGTVWAFGSDYYGQLGTDSNFSDYSNEWVRWGENLNDIVDISAGANHAVALRSDGTVWACGDNSWGQLGFVGHSNEWEGTPQEVYKLTDVKAISAGLYHTVALKKDGTVWGWGDYNGMLHLGRNRNIQVRIGDSVYTYKESVKFPIIPEQIKNIDNIVSIEAGTDHSVMLKNDGTVWTYGNNQSGQLGTGDTICTGFVEQAKGLSGIVAIAAGDGCTVVLREDGTVWTWGQYIIKDNEPYKKVYNTFSPVKVEGLNNVVGISVRGYSSEYSGSYAIAVINDGTLWSWGNKEYESLGIGSSEKALVPVQVKNLRLFTPESKQQIKDNTQAPDITVEGASDWALTGVKAIKEYQLADDDVFKDLSKPIERQEFAVLAVKLYQKATNTVQKISDSYSFTDIKDCKYKDFVQQAYELKIVNGSEGKFRPTDTITRQEVCILLQNLMKAIEPNGSYEVTDDVKFTDDSDIAPWARNAVVYAYQNKIINGTGEFKMSPCDTATVEQAMVLIYNLGVSKGYIS